MKKKIKLKDLTPEQWDNYVDRCKMTCYKCAFNVSSCRLSECKGSWVNNKDMFSDKFLDQEIEIDVPDVLTESEREYLSNIIKPFRYRVFGIQKVIGSGYCDISYISIVVDSISALKNRETIDLPFFQKDNLYKGMKKNCLYTLEELGL